MHSVKIESILTKPRLVDYNKDKVDKEIKVIIKHIPQSKMTMIATHMTWRYVFSAKQIQEDGAKAVYDTFLGYPSYKR